MQEFIKCLKAYLKNEKLNKIDNDKDLINLAIEQSLQTLLYPVYQDKTYKKYYVSWVLKQESFISLQNEISNIFNVNNIKHLFFKGSVLCNLYDDPSIRTRGDIDVYIDPNDLEKARSLLISNGYEFKPADTMHNEDYYKNDILIELHFNIFDEEVSKKWQKYFIKPFDISTKVEKSLYQLNDNAHFIYCLAHFAKHLLKGAGIRYILDFYYMLKKTNIDYDKLHKDLEELELSRLYNNVLNVIYYLTEEKLDDFQEEDILYFIDYMLKSGIHGFGKENEFDISQGLSGHKWHWIKCRLFLTDKSYRKALFPKLGAKAILYPICLIIHWIKLIFTGLFRRTKLLFRIIFKKNNRKDLFKKLGI